MKTLRSNKGNYYFLSSSPFVAIITLDVFQNTLLPIMTDMVDLESMSMMCEAYNRMSKDTYLREKLHRIVKEYLNDDLAVERDVSTKN